MAEEARNLTIALSSDAILSLQEIWSWNAAQHGVEHADKYRKFILSRVNELKRQNIRGCKVPGIPRLSYLIIRHRRRGHGHLAVYEIINDVIHVLNFYHTAQDWQTRLPEDYK